MFSETKRKKLGTLKTEVFPSTGSALFLQYAYDILGFMKIGTVTRFCNTRILSGLSKEEKNQ